MSDATRKETGATNAAAIGRRSTGWLLVAAAVVMVAFMLHHPHVGAHDPDGFAKGVMKIARVNRIVHGVLIINVALIASGVIGLARALDARRTRVRSAVVFLVLGAFLLINTAVINGFAIADFVNHETDQASRPLDLEQRSILEFAHSFGQAAAGVGVVLWSIGVFLFGVALLPRAGFSRAAGIVGILSGSLPATALIFGRLSLNVRGFTIFVVAQAAFLGLAGIGLARGSVGEDD